MRPAIKRFFFGLGAGAASLALAYLLRVTAGAVFLPELAVNTLVSKTPGSVESILVINLQSLAKYSAFAGAIAINLVVYGILAVIITRYKRNLPFLDRVPVYFFAGYAVTLTITVVFLSTTQVLSSPQSLPTVILALLPSQFLFGFVLAEEERLWPIAAGVICEPLEPPAKSKKKKFDARRRLFIEAGVATAVAGVLLYYGVGLLFPKSPPATTSTDPTSSLYSQEVTSNGNFYRVDVNVFPPSVDKGAWSLKVSGMVSTPLTIDYAKLISMTPVEQYNTLMCVSNTVGGDLVSTAKWTGVRLNEILGMAGAQSGATYVVFKSVDGYSVGIPISTAMLDGTILAYQMNGEPLPQEHGFPLRAVVPGLYGMMNAKWITSIEVTGEVYEGYWQQRGWENDAHYNTESWIVTPGASQVDQRFGIGGSTTVRLGSVPVAGVAFAGDRGIEKVEVSADEGKTWTQASIKDPLSGNTWVLWKAEWNPPAVGSYKLTVRATDGAGAVQTAVISDPFPNGVTGYHVVDVGVVSG